MSGPRSGRDDTRVGRPVRRRGFHPNLSRPKQCLASSEAYDHRSTKCPRDAQTSGGVAPKAATFGATGTLPNAVLRTVPFSPLATSFGAAD